MARAPGAIDFNNDTESGGIMDFSIPERKASAQRILALPHTETSTLFSNEKLVAKMSWPHANRGLRAEGSVIIAVRRSLEKKKPNYLRHIVEPNCSVTNSMDQIAHPRAGTDLPCHEADDPECVCRTLVLRRYERLEAVTSVEDFKIIFIDVVRGKLVLLSWSHIA